MFHARSNTSGILRITERSNLRIDKIEGTLVLFQLHSSNKKRICSVKRAVTYCPFNQLVYIYVRRSGPHYSWTNATFCLDHIEFF